MSWTRVQGNVIATGAATTLSVVLGANPTKGNTVCVALLVGNSDPGSPITVADSNGNAYTLTPHSPQARANVNTAYVVLAYLINAPANASKTITATWVTNESAIVWADEFSCAGATAVFDKDIGANPTTNTTILNSPTITPTNPNELLYAACSGAQVINHPLGGAVQGVWTGATTSPNFGVGMVEYDLSATSATAVDFTQSPSAAGWASLAMAFYSQDDIISVIGQYDLVVV